MERKHNPNLTLNARALRKNMTKEERHLWYDFLKSMSIMVHRQKVIDRYIVDFYIAEAKLVIELDGSQHYDPEGMRADVTRDAYLRSLVSRFFVTLIQMLTNALKAFVKIF